MNKLKYLRELKQLSQSDMGNYLGITGQAYGLYENGKRTIGHETLVKLSNFFNVSIDYLLGIEENKSNKFYMAPVYGKISAGLPNWVEECIEGRIPLDCDLMNITNPSEHFFLRVNGESMNKIIKNGAYALIHKQDFVDDGDIAVVLVNDDEATLKKFSIQGDFIILIPESNDDSFKQQIYTKADNIKVIGKYIGKMEFN